MRVYRAQPAGAAVPDRAIVVLPEAFGVNDHIQDGKDVGVETFPGAGHAFHCDARPQMYRAGAAQRAWGLAMDLFASTLPA
jgi:dienelactone hydrolase